MYPKEILPGIDLYVIFICLAAVCGIIMARVLFDKMKYKAKLQNLCIFNAVASIVVGYFSAVVFQAIYNIPKNGGFKIDGDTGATFYGGLIGGAACFLLVYFIVGRLLFGKGGVHLTGAFGVIDVGAASVALGHGLGRIGCLMAGCCHGKVTDAWYGIYMPAVGAKVIPAQLFEAIFLFALSAFIALRVCRKRSYNLALYMGTYGLWRFILEEYVRDDYRGYTFTEHLTPSQLTAVIMIVGSVVLFLAQRLVVLKLQKREGKAVSYRQAVLLACALASLWGVIFVELFRSDIVSYSQNAYLIASRAAGAVTCIFFLLMTRSKRVLYAKPMLKATLTVLPCMLIAINNFPFIAFFTGKATIDGSARSVFTFVLVCLCVGLFEELAFRGCVFTAILQRRGKKPVDVFLAILLSSAVFAVIHLLNLFEGASVGYVILQVGYSFLIGAMCSVILVKTRNIWYCVILHAVYNFAGSVVLECGKGEFWDIWNVPTIILTAVIAVAVAVYVIYLLVKIKPCEIEALVNDTPKSEQNSIENTSGD